MDDTKESYPETQPELMENTPSTDDSPEHILQEERKKIQEYLGIDARTATDFARQVLRLREVEASFAKGGVFLEDKDRKIALLLETATKSLEYEKGSYQIAFVGATSSGKSTLINALLGGRSLSKALGAASVTGTVIKIFFQDSDEKVVVTPRKEEDIISLVRRGMIEEFGTEQTLPTQLNQNFAKQLQKWQPNENLSEKQRHRFEKTRSALADIVEHYLNLASDNKISSFLFPEKLIFDCFELVEDGFKAPLIPNVEEYLLKLVDENSSLNKTEHRISLVQSISYYIKPQDKQNQLQLSLPRHICLVDLPGFNPDKPLHDIIFVEGIEKANIAVLILRPDPPQEKGAHMYELVKKHIEPENIFLVVNRWDQLPQNDYEEKNRLETIMKEVIEDLKIYDYYKVVASAAYDAQLGLQSKDSEIRDRVAYEKAVISLGVSNPDDYEKVLEESNVPKLLDDLMGFINDRFLIGQKLVGKGALDDICRILAAIYPNIPEDDLKTIGKVGEYLEERLENLEQIVAKFHLQKMQTENLQHKLEKKVAGICNSIDYHLLQKVPDFWKDCFEVKPDIHFLGKGGLTLKTEAMWLIFLDKLQFEIWQQLSGENSQYMQDLTDILMHDYQTNLERDLDRAILTHITSLVPLSEEEKTEVSEKIKTGMEYIQKHLTVFSQYVVLSKATHETISLTSKTTYQEELQESLHDLAKLGKEVLESDKFKPLMNVVHGFYKQALTPHALDDLLRLYEYSVAFAHNNLLENLRIFFTKLKRQAGNDHTLALTILEAYQIPDPERRNSVAAKRKAIQQLCNNTK